MFNSFHYILDVIAPIFYSCFEMQNVNSEECTPITLTQKKFTRSMEQDPNRSCQICLKVFSSKLSLNYRDIIGKHILKLSRSEKIKMLFLHHNGLQMDFKRANNFFA